MKFSITRWICVASLATTLLMLTAPPASALKLQGQGWVGAGVANIHHAAPTAAGWWGPSLQTGLVLDLSDFWKLTADAGISHHFPRTVDDDRLGPHTIISTALGLRYAFDVAIYVPYAGLSVVYQPLGPPSDRFPEGEFLAARATIGVDYRRSRSMSIGAAAELSAPLTQPAEFPLYSTIRAHIGFHFRRF